MKQCYSAGCGRDAERRITWRELVPVGSTTKMRGYRGYFCSEDAERIRARCMAIDAILLKDEPAHVEDG